MVQVLACRKAVQPGQPLFTGAFCGALVGGLVVIVALGKVLIWGKLLVCPNPKYPAFTPPKGGGKPLSHLLVALAESHSAAEDYERRVNDVHCGSFQH